MMEEITVAAVTEKYCTTYDYNLEFLKNIPPHWKLRRFRDVFSLGKGLNITKERLQEKGIPCINYGEIHSKFPFEVDPNRDPLKRVDEAFLTSSPNSLLRFGDFIFADTSEDIEGSGNFTYLNSHAITFAGYHTIIARPKDADLNHRFIAYLLHSISYRGQIRKAVKGVKVFSITNAILKNTTLWFPFSEEQRRIVSFLDRKTAQIDKAIAQKEKLIELLKERRQILIHNAVNRGLNPSVKMKDSAVEWIGEVPEHWQIVANRALFSERNEPGNHDLPILSVSIHTAVSAEELDDEENMRGKIRIEDKSKYKFVDVGDIVFNMMRAWQGAIGAVSVRGMVSPAYIVAKPKRRINAQYFENLYRTEKYIQRMDCVSKGITDFRKRLYWDEFKQLITLLPPSNEQEEIVDFISRLQNSTNRAINCAEKAKEKLKEYKAILIDSVTTGRIGV